MLRASPPWLLDLVSVVKVVLGVCELVSDGSGSVDDGELVDCLLGELDELSLEVPARLDLIEDEVLLDVLVKLLRDALDELWVLAPVSDEERLAPELAD